MATTEIPLLTLIDEFPDRKLSQERFDEKVRTNMRQLKAFVNEMDEQVIPAINSLGVEVQNNADKAAQKATAAANSASAAATSAGNAANSATTAGTKAEEAATSASNAEESADAARTKAGEAATSAEKASDKAQDAGDSASAAQQSAQSAAASLTAAREAVAEAQEQLRIVQEAQARINHLADEAQATLDVCMTRLNAVEASIAYEVKRLDDRADVIIGNSNARIEYETRRLSDRIETESQERENAIAALVDALNAAEARQAEALAASEDQLIDRISADEMSTSRQMAEVACALQRQGLHTRAEVARLEGRIDDNQISSSQQSAALTQASLEQGKRLSALAAIVTCNQLSASKQSAQHALTSLRQDRRLDALAETVTDNFLASSQQAASLAATALRQEQYISHVARKADSRLDAFMSFVNQRLAQLSLASVLQSRRLGVNYPSAPRDIATWVNDEDGQQFDFSTMHFSSDDGSVVLPGAGLTFDPD